MNDVLFNIENRLSCIDGISVSLRGHGVGQFLYVHSGIRSVEVSMHESSVFVEYWMVCDEESDDPPFKEEAYLNAELSVGAVVEWLAGNGL